MGKPLSVAIERHSQWHGRIYTLQMMFDKSVPYAIVIVKSSRVRARSPAGRTLFCATMEQLNFSFGECCFGATVFASDALA